MTDQKTKALEALDYSPRIGRGINEIPDYKAYYLNLVKHYETIREALSEPQWQDISTAPRDGAEILVYVAGEYGETKYIGSYWYEPEGIWRNHLGSWLKEETPTYWQSLPDPPTGGIS